MPYITLEQILHESSIPHYVVEKKPEGDREIKIEEILLDLIYEKRVDRWFGRGVDIWLRLFFGFGLPKGREGTSLLPCSTAFRFDHMLGIDSPSTVIQVGPVDPLFEGLKKELPRGKTLVIGPAEYRWTSQPVDCARVVGSFYRLALDNPA